MADIVNLRLARKRKSREEKDEKAATNRALFGRTKAERDRDLKLAEKSRRDLDGHKRGD